MPHGNRFIAESTGNVLDTKTGKRHEFHSYAEAIAAAAYMNFQH
jgi:hypothetical protein